MAVITIREALNQALDEELKRDQKVYIIGEEVGHYDGAYKVTQGLLKKYGDDRVIDTPIAEAGFAGIGVGSAMVGLRPIVEFMTWNFSLVAIDQIISNAAKLRQMSGGQLVLPIVFRAPQGAGGALAAQHSQILESFYTYIPGLKVVAPATAKDMKGMLKTAIRDDNPVIFLEGEKMYNLTGEVPEDEFLVEFGKADVSRTGKDISILCWSYTWHIVMKAVEELDKMNISAEVLDLRSLRPLDEEAIFASVRKTNRVLIVQEAWPVSSFGSHLSHIIQNAVFDYLDAPVEVLSSEDASLAYAFPLEESALISVPKVISAVKKVLR